MKRHHILTAFIAAATASLVVGLGAGPANATAATKTASYGPINIQLSFLKNTEFAGEYEAVKQGYFKKEGFNDVTLTAGGGSVTAESEVASGKALIGDSGPLITGPAILKGAKLKIIAAEYQKNPFDIVSLKSDPINTPADLKGKTIAVFDPSELYWDAFLKANKINPSTIKVVPYTDGASQLASGQVNGYMGFATQYTDTVGTNDQPVQQFLLSQEGLPGVDETLMATTAEIQSHRAELVAALTAIAEGWKYAVAHNSAATNLTIDDFGKSQDYTYASQLAAIKAQDPLMSTSETNKNGLLTISPSLEKETVTGMKLAGIDISSKQLFDTSLINAVYKQHPNLK